MGSAFRRLEELKLMDAFWGYCTSLSPFYLEASVRDGIILNETNFSHERAVGNDLRSWVVVIDCIGYWEYFSTKGLNKNTHHIASSIYSSSSATSLLLDGSLSP